MFSPSLVTAPSKRRGGFSDGFGGALWHREGTVLSADGNETQNVLEPTVIVETPPLSYVARLTALGATGIWRGQEASGNLADESGANHPLTAGGTPSYRNAGPTDGIPATQHPYAPGSYSASSSFSSSDAAYQGTGAFTAGLWVKTPTPATGQIALSRDNVTPSSNRSWSMYLSATNANKVNFYIFSGGSNTPLVSAASIPADTWVHVVVVYIPSVSMTIFVNGVQDAQRTTSVFASLNSNTTPLVVGRGSTVGGETPWLGQSCGAFFVPAALTAAQIRQVYDAGLFMTTDPLWRLWYTGGYGGSVGTRHAQSQDGLTWYRWRDTPLLSSRVRPFVMKNGATYYLYVANSTDQQIDAYTSTDGVDWVLAKQPAIAHGGAGTWDAQNVANSSVILDGDGTWKMLHDGGAGADWKIGLATSPDGLNWTESPSNPVLVKAGGLGGLGSAHLIKIGSTYWIWYLQSSDSAGLVPTQFRRASSSDLITWTPDPGATFGQAGTDEGRDSVNGQIGDPHLIEVAGKVYLYYDAGTNGLAQSGQFHIKRARFDGTLAQLVASREDRPGPRWTVRGNMSVWDGGELLIPYGTESLETPSVITGYAPTGYTMTFVARTLAGTTPEIRAVVAYVNDSNFAVIKSAGSGATYYQEKIAGVWGSTTSLGANNACDGANHTWRITRTATTVALSIDGAAVGSPAAIGATFQVPAAVGIAAQQTSVTVDSFAVL